ncbi:MAG: acyl-CoA thioesterase [bacterium]
MGNRYFEIKVNPRFDEIDSYGIVHHKAYFSWFEEARFYLAEKLGLLPRIVDGEWKILVIECGCSYKIPARYHDRLLVRVLIDNDCPNGLLFRYRVLRECDNEEIAIGFTKHAFVRNSKLLIKIPQEIKEKLEEYYGKK